MEYDDLRGETVLFGGTGNTNGGNRYDDTWEFGPEIISVEPPANDALSTVAIIVTGGDGHRLGDGTWSYDGEVRLNGLLRIVPSVNTTINTSSSRIAGQGAIWLDGVPLLGDVKLYEGSFEFNARTGESNSLFESISDFNVAGLPFHLSSIGFAGDDAIRVQGRIELPGALGGASIDIDGDHFVTLSLSQGLSYDVAINDINVNVSVGGATFIAQNTGAEISNVGIPQIRLHGIFSIPQLKGLTIDFDPNQGKYFQIDAEGNVELNGCVLMPDRLNFGPRLYLSSLEICYSSTENIFSWAGTAGLPLGRNGVEASANFTILDGCLDEVGFGLADLSVPIYAPIVYLEGGSGNIQGLCAGSIDGIVIDLAASFTAGPEFEVGGNDYSLIWLQLTGTVDLSGKIAGTADLKVGNQNDPIISGDAVVLLDLGEGVYLRVHLVKPRNNEPFLDLTGEAALDWNNNFQTGLDGVIQIPNDAFIIGAIAGGQQFTTRAYAQASADGNDSNDYLAAGVHFNVGGTSLGHVIEVSLADGDIDWFSSWDRVLEVNIGPGRGDVPPFPVAPGVEMVIFRATWATGSADLELADPNGQPITPANVDSFPDVQYFTNPAVPEAFYVVNNPTAGDWTLQLVGVAEGTLSHLQQSNQPSIVVHTPSGATTDAPIDINWTAVDTDSNASIQLFIDRNRSSADGVMIASGLSEDTDTSFNWTPAATVASGDYYVYAVIDDGLNLPFVSYSTGKVRVTQPAAPEPPTLVAAAAGPTSDAMHIAWTQSTSPDVDHYRVYYSSNPAGENFESSIAAEDLTSVVVEGLTPGQTYRVAVAAVDVDGNISHKSEPILVRPRNALNNSPIFTGNIASKATVGQPYQSQVLSADIDQQPVLHALANEPTGMSITPSGLITWTPAANQIGNHEFTVMLNDQVGGMNSQSFDILVTEAGMDNRPPEILSFAPASVVAGTPFSYPVKAADPDMGDTLGYSLMLEPVGAAVTTSGSVEYDVPSGSGRYEFVVRVQDGQGLFDIQRFTVQADADAPVIDAIWGDMVAPSPTSIDITANPVVDATGPAEYLLEVDGLPGTWQSQPAWSVASLLPNMQHDFRIQARDRAVPQNTSDWSSNLMAHTLAAIPPAPTPGATDLTTIELTLSPGENPPTTELALWNKSDKTWIGLDGMPSAMADWADAATWGMVVVTGLQVDTTYHFQAMARNNEGIETALSTILVAKTAAPNSLAQIDVSRASVAENAIGSMQNQVTLSASFVNDPYSNAFYTYTWLTPTHPDTGKAMVLVAGGGPTDSFATYASPEAPSADSTPYTVQCMITGAAEGNYVFGAVEIEVVKPGDVNLNGLTNGDDVQGFVDVILGVETEPRSVAAADLDGSGSVDLDDLGLFSMLLIQSAG
ncbi:MAG: fibronectin type III domain-containing protein [Phycisphaerales bacterium]|nr:fibronectin type III domain-containing protein [Phycisphaerales bacterium]MCB9855326.1 fibronectin type III domain-containing protein [Phycisphaerales bacterium]MCB9862919.1 fibronectin type III domain-containing protein [Phycisphaerales bacterium]